MTLGTVIWLFRIPVPNNGSNDILFGDASERVDMVRARSVGGIIALAGRPGFLTALAFWFRSSVVSVLDSLTAIMKVSSSLLALIFAVLVPRALLATRGRDDLVIALPACVVGEPLFSFSLPTIPSSIDSIWGFGSEN